MNKYILTIVICFFLSCKKEIKPQPKTNKTVAVSLPQKKSSVAKKDTIFFYYKDNLKLTDYALASLLEKKYAKDSICNTKFKIEFILNNKLVFTDFVEIKGYSEGADWFGSFEFEGKNKSFKTITNGYPACGYTQDNFLYQISEKQSHRIHHFQSVGDGGWFSVPEMQYQSNEKFTVVTHNFWPEENSENSENPDAEMGNHEFLDSIIFTFENNKWKMKNITPVGKIFRSYNQPYEEYLNSQQ